MTFDLPVAAILLTHLGISLSQSATCGAGLDLQCGFFAIERESLRHCTYYSTIQQAQALSLYDVEAVKSYSASLGNDL